MLRLKSQTPDLFLQTRVEFSLGLDGAFGCGGRQTGEIHPLC